MKLSELMKNVTPSADFSGYVMADDMVLAIDTSEGQDAEVGDYAVVQIGIEGVDPSLNSETSEKNYLRAGKSSTKTGTQRKFKITGDIYVGDAAQDKMLSHEMKYATGNAAIVNYVYFNMLTGKGEKGQATVAVNGDGSGNGGENAGLDIELSKVGSKPVEYTYGETGKSTRLASITGLTLSPAFASGTYDYTAAVSGTSSTITATAVDAENASVTMLVGGEVKTGAVTWASGVNIVTIVITNGDAAPSTYTIKVTK